MWFFHIILFLISFVITILKISLIRSNKIKCLYICGICIIPIAFYKYAVTFNSSEIITFFSSLNSISNICLLLTIESIILMLLYIQFLLEKENKTKYKILTLLPSWGFIIGIFVFLVLTYNFFTGISFLKSALYFTGILFVIISSIFILLEFITNRNTRLNIFIICCFFQLITSIFLPLLINIKTSIQTNMQVNLKALLFTFIVSILFIYTGTKFKNIKKIILKSRS
ncbi:MAG: hypothetical protein M0R46_08245 [Candidatus Muirbacterium halophilum]|nr:hypothetical protein [Candidatus Muirbacterium halophilum]MCK9475893.1 hypothetical protein [Candidatus Muirbacterium halophilum]